MCACFGTLLFELDEKSWIVSSCVACFWTAADRMGSSSTMKHTGLLAEIPLVTGVCAVEFEPPNLVVWRPEIL